LSPHFALGYASYKFMEGIFEKVHAVVAWQSERQAILQGMRITPRSQSLTGPSTQTGTGGLSGFLLQKERENTATTNRMAEMVATQTSASIFGEMGAAFWHDKEIIERRKFVADMYRGRVETLRKSGYSEAAIQEYLRNEQFIIGKEGAQPSREAEILIGRRIQSELAEYFWTSSVSPRANAMRIMKFLLTATGKISDPAYEEELNLEIYRQRSLTDSKVIDQAIAKTVDMRFRELQTKIKSVADADERGIRESTTVGRVMNKLDNIRADQTVFYFYRPLQQAQRRD